MGLEHCHRGNILKRILLSTGGWNSYNMRQAVPEDAQKSKNLLYLVSLKCKTAKTLGLAMKSDGDTDSQTCTWCQNYCKPVSDWACNDTFPMDSRTFCPSFIVALSDKGVWCSMVRLTAGSKAYHSLKILPKGDYQSMIMDYLLVHWM